MKLPSFRSSSSQEEEEVAHDKKKGPFHGMTKKVVNLAANKAGKAPAKLMLKLGATASDVRKLRDLFNWEDATKTLGFLLVNLVAVVLHFYLPIRYFAMPVVVGMFFVLSEKSKAIERIACHAFAARKRYVHLRRLKKGYDKPTSPLLRLPTARPVPQHKKSHLPSFGRGHNRQLVKSVVRGIFSRLDDDASGSVDGRELISFVEEALPRATPRAVAKLGGDAATAKLAVERLVQKFDANGIKAASDPFDAPRYSPRAVAARLARRTPAHRYAIAVTPSPRRVNPLATLPRAGDGQIDRTEFESIVQKSGCVDVLTQDELRRQLTAEGGLHCSKRPSHEAHFPMTASHTTSLNVQASNKKVDGYRIHKLVWTTVKGESKSADDVKKIVASMTAPSVLLVHRASTAPLQFDVGVFFRDPLVDLLTMLCTGRPLEAGQALDPSRIDAISIKSPSSRALRLEDSDGEIGEDF